MAKLGSGQITLTDLTDIRPARMDLAASLSSIQSQVGEVYEPDYTKSNQVITPTVFFGNKEAEIASYKESIIYSFNNKEYKYNDEDDGKAYVNTNGAFVIKENLSNSVVIKATVPSLSCDGVEYTNISETFDLHKVSYDSGYQLWIESEDNRYDFNFSSTSDIKLSFVLYSGAEKLEINDSRIVSKQWYKGTTEVGTTETLVVKRIDIDGHETYILEITLDTGIKLRAQVGIDDRTDNYYNEIIAGGTTLLTPKNNSVSLTCQVWTGTEKVESSDNISIEYEWRKGETLIEGAITRSISFEANESTTVYCRAIIKQGDKVLGQPLSYIAIQYTEPYEVILSSDTVFIPCYSNDKLRGDNFEKTITFKIIGDDGNPLPFDASRGDDIKINGDSLFDFTISTESIWEKTITIATKEKDLGEWNSKTYIINYTYLGIDFSKDISLIKNYQGQDGTAAITLDLTNSFHRFAGSQSAAFPDQKITFSYNAKIAERDLSVDKIRVGKYVFIGFSATGEEQVENNTYKEIEKGLYLAYNSEDKTFSLRTRTGSETSNLTMENGSFSIYFTVSLDGIIATPQTFVKDYSYGYTITGNSYSLEVSPQSIIYSPANNSFSANTIVIKPKWQEGGRGDYKDFTKGIVKYSTGDDFTLLTESTIPIESNQITQYIFRLYENDVLLDEETIPLITSMDGIEIGGENLLRWTKKLNTKWEKNEKVNVREEDAFGIATLSSSATFISPKVETTSEMIGKTLCLSFYARSSDWTNVIDFIPSISSYSDYSSSSVAVATKNGELIVDEEKESNKWVKMYTLLSVPISEDITIKNVKITFSLGEGIIELKKPKLELGNIPTDWCTSPYDNDIASGINTSYQLVINTDEPYFPFAEELQPNTFYTFSFESAAYTGAETSSTETNFLCDIYYETPVEVPEDELAKEPIKTSVASFSCPNNITSKFIHTFQFDALEDKEYKLRIYASPTQDPITNPVRILTLNQVKLEEGTEATSFFISETYLSSLLSEIEENRDSITVINEDGDRINMSLEALEKEIHDLNERTITIDEVNATISTATSKYYVDDGYLARLKGQVEMSASETNNPYIAIYTRTVSSDAEKTFFGTVVEKDKLSFYNKEYFVDETQQKPDPVAYIGSEKLMINQAQFNNSFSIGDLIVTITESGVGFTW